MCVYVCIFKLRCNPYKYKCDMAQDACVSIAAISTNVIWPKVHCVSVAPISTNVISQVYVSIAAISTNVIPRCIVSIAN